MKSDTLRTALEQIADFHIPSQPETDARSEHEWALHHIANLRGIAKRAIALDDKRKHNRKYPLRVIFE
jgi:hypothetical protein